MGYNINDQNCFMPRRSKARPLKEPHPVQRDRTITLSTAEVCQIFNVPKATLHFWLRQERIPHPLQDPDSRGLIWTQTEIDALQRYLSRSAAG